MGDPGLRKWIGVCNRAEKLKYSPDGLGVQCEWRWTSELHAPQIIKRWGKKIVEASLQDFPISLEAVKENHQFSEQPHVSFIIGHRGMERLPLLQATLKTLANQDGANCETIVVEESVENELERNLPRSIRYFHLKIASRNQPYNRARTFNAGAKLARSKLLVFHDNDLLVPRNYTHDLLQKMSAGYEVINLKRFIYYLSELQTSKLLQTNECRSLAPEAILQNATGGGSLAVEKDAFERIGGFDEGFVGWGGEDVEFWDRAQVLKLYNYGHIPLVHLWHAPQLEKNPEKNSEAMKRLHEVSKIDVGQRIRRLSRVFNEHSHGQSMSGARRNEGKYSCE
jgi:hypothetical protein